jgi:hypothetical protein
LSANVFCLSVFYSISGRNTRDVRVSGSNTSLPSQSLEQLWKSFLRSLMGQLQKHLHQLTVTVRSAAIAINRSSQVHGRASSPFAKSMLPSQRHHQFALNRRRYSFLRSHLSALDSPVTSQLRSASTAGFSSSNSRKRFMSEACMPPYFDLPLVVSRFADFVARDRRLSPSAHCRATQSTTARSRPLL